MSEKRVSHPRLVSPILKLLPTLWRKARPSDLMTLRELVRAKFPDVNRVADPAEACANLSGVARPIIVDARSREEYEVSHLQGAIHADEFGLVSRSLGKALPIVVYCAVGYRSSALARELKQDGFTNVSSLDGGIFQWANDGGPVYRDGEPVREVHPYQRKWRTMLRVS